MAGGGGDVSAVTVATLAAAILAALTVFSVVTGATLSVNVVTAASMLVTVLLLTYNDMHI